MSILKSVRPRLISALRQQASASRLSIERSQTALSMTVVEDKKAVRKSTSRLLKEAETSSLEQQSASIIDKVLQSAFFKTSRSTGLYLTCAKLREVDTSRLLEQILSEGSSGRRCYAPAVEDKESNMNFLHVDSLEGVEEMPPYGIREPTQLYADGRPRDNVLQMDNPLDLLIMTGQAFDRKGGRLGRGGGYYDKFIARCYKKAKNNGHEPPLLAALAFREQVVQGSVPKGDDDADMDILVLPDEMLACSEGGRAAIQL